MYEYDPEEFSNPVSLSIKSMWQLDKLRSVPKEKVACIDVETTGLRPGNDEILQVSICNGNGTMLLNSYVRPERRKRWPKAQEINHITWEMVKDAPTLIELSYAIEAILADCELLIGYNINKFDLHFLEVGRVNIPLSVNVYDLINDCSVLYGKWSDYHENYTFVSLASVAKRFGIDYRKHDSSEDVIATTKVFYALLEDEKLNAEVARIEKDRAETKERVEALKRESLERYLREKQLVEAEPKKQPKKTSSSKETANGCVGCLVLVLVLTMLLGMCSNSCRSSRRSARASTPIEQGR